MKWNMVLLTTTVAINLAGCAVMGSDPNFAVAGTPLSGIPYLVPKALLPVEVIDASGNVRVDVLDRVLVGDPEQSFSLRHRLSPFGDDTVKVEVDPATSLLKTIDLKSEDKTGDVLKKIAGLIFRSEAAAGERVVYRGLLDASDPTTIAQANDDIRFVLSRLGDDCKPVAADTCEPYQRVRADAGNFYLELRPLGNVARFDVPAAAPDCTLGVCHRGNLPYRLTARLLGQSKSTIVHLPNNAPLLVLPLGRQPLVTVTHKAVFKDGMLESYDATKPSSALAIVSWPLEALDAVLDATSKVVQFTIGTNAKDLELERAKLDHDKAMLALDEERKNLGKPRAEAAVSRVPVLSVGLRSTTPTIPQAPADPVVPRGAANPTPVLIQQGSDGAPKQ